MVVTFLPISLIRALKKIPPKGVSVGDKLNCLLVNIRWRVKCRERRSDQGCPGWKSMQVVCASPCVRKLFVMCRQLDRWGAMSISVARGGGGVRKSIR